MPTPPTVALARCADYGAALPDAVAAVLAPWGGLGRFVRPGQTVLIKPNLLTDRAPDAAVTTHPELVRVLIRLVRQAGARPVVADSPASAVKIERVFATTGFAALCQEEDVPLVNLEKAGSELHMIEGHPVSIARPAMEADAILNVPKVKTHVLTTLTAAVKNLYGLVPGYQKTQLHKAFPRPADFGRLMAAIYRLVPPALTVADAVVGMEGEGPSGGTPVPLGFLAAADDAAALDRTLCRILRIPVRAVPYLQGPAAADGAWHHAPALHGARIEDLQPASFRIPSTLGARLIPRPLARLLGRFIWIRPVFGEACVACGQCVKACPAAALTQERKRRPELDPAACIGCCCCHEVCPADAVAMEQSPLLNAVRRGKMI